mmetsp:Transcript_87868/g.262021  ORF Transcript_87868/g.262021 Transcript_87868/m.262021 type:complete len:224 (+) Transcript_87868:1158-1829(+)
MWARPVLLLQQTLALDAVNEHGDPLGGVQAIAVYVEGVPEVVGRAQSRPEHQVSHALLNIREVPVRDNRGGFQADLSHDGLDVHTVSVGDEQQHQEWWHKVAGKRDPDPRIAGSESPPVPERHSRRGHRGDLSRQETPLLQKVVTDELAEVLAVPLRDEAQQEGRTTAPLLVEQDTVHEHDEQEKCGAREEQCATPAHIPCRDAPQALLLAQMSALAGQEPNL